MNKGWGGFIIECQNWLQIKYRINYLAWEIGNESQIVLFSAKDLLFLNPIIIYFSFFVLRRMLHSFYCLPLNIFSRLMIIHWFWSKFNVWSLKNYSIVAFVIAKIITKIFVLIILKNKTIIANLCLLLNLYRTAHAKENPTAHCSVWNVDFEVFS